MNAWTCGFCCSFLVLAPLVGPGGTQPNSPASPQQVDEKESVRGRDDASQHGRVLIARFPYVSQGPKEDSATNLRQTYEDVEIYRRLLSRTIAPYVAGPYLASYSQQVEKAYFQGKSNPHANLESNALRVDGVYLPPTGIIFTADIPGRIPLPTSEKGPAKPKPMTEWDRARRELRGEKLDVPVTPAPREKSHFLDTILHSLAENGHNLDLAPDQTVTVVLTSRLDAMQQCQKCHTNVIALTADRFTSSSPGAPVTTGTFFQPNAPEGQPPAGYWASSSTGAKVPQPQGEFNRQPGSESNNATQNDQALLGDLHFKQGHYDEAAAAYTKAIKEIPLGGVDAWAMNPSSTSPELRSVVLKLIELQNRIIQCEIALKQEEKVHRSFGDLKRWMAVLENINAKADGKKSDASDRAGDNSDCPCPTR